MKLEFDLNEYVQKIQKSENYFHTFINKDSLAVGVLRLEPGQQDTQMPHVCDEVYYVIKGDGFLNISGRNYVVKEGTAFFVGKKIEHRFHGNTTELIVIYFFGGPDS